MWGANLALVLPCSPLSTCARSCHSRGRKVDTVEKAGQPAKEVWRSWSVRRTFISTEEKPAWRVTVCWCDCLSWGSCAETEGHGVPAFILIASQTPSLMCPQPLTLHLDYIYISLTTTHSKRVLLLLWFLIFFFFFIFSLEREWGTTHLSW